MHTFFALGSVPVLAASDGQSSGGGSPYSLVLLLVALVVMYFLMIRPQRRRSRERQALQAELGVGDEVVTTSGIYGTITGEDGPTRFWLEVDDDVQIRVARAAVQARVPDDPIETDDDSSGDSNDDAAHAAADDD